MQLAGVLRHQGWTFCLELLMFPVLLADLRIQMRATLKGDYGRKARRQTRLWMYVDFLAMLPIDAIGYLLFLNSPEVPVFLHWFSLLKLIKLARILLIIRVWQENHALRAVTFRLLFFISFSSFVAHWIACGWLVIGETHAHIENIYPYLGALYWAVTTLTTVGYGDITPHTNLSTIYTMFVMVLGVGFYGYVIGNVASLLSGIDAAKAQHNRRLEQLTAFIKHRRVPEPLQKRLINYYRHFWDRGHSENEKVILDSLPFSLKTDVSLFLNKEIIEGTPLFQGASDEMIREVVKQLRPILATPGDYIIRKGEPADSMYFIHDGLLEVLSSTGSGVVATLKKGQFFGEMSLLKNEPRNASIRSKDYSHLYILNKSHFQKVLNHFPEFKTYIADIVKERESQRTSRESE